VVEEQFSLSARLVTDLRLYEDSAEFVVATDAASIQDALLHLGWSPAGPGTFGRRFYVPTADIEPIYERFTR
jgi:hypothetical protein